MGVQITRLAQKRTLGALGALLLTIPGAVSAQVNSISALSELRPGDWAYEELNALGDLYCQSVQREAFVDSLISVAAGLDFAEQCKLAIDRKIESWQENDEDRFGEDPRQRIGVVVAALRDMGSSTAFCGPTGSALGSPSFFKLRILPSNRACVESRDGGLELSLTWQNHSLDDLSVVIGSNFSDPSFDPNGNTSELSGGMRQRVALGRALDDEPDTVVFDEISGLSESRVLGGSQVSDELLFFIPGKSGGFESVPHGAISTASSTAISLFPGYVQRVPFRGKANAESLDLKKLGEQTAELLRYSMTFVGWKCGDAIGSVSGGLSALTKARKDCAASREPRNRKAKPRLQLKEAPVSGFAVVSATQHGRARPTNRSRTRSSNLLVEAINGGSGQTPVLMIEFDFPMHSPEPENEKPPMIDPSPPNLTEGTDLFDAVCQSDGATEGRCREAKAALVAEFGLEALALIGFSGWDRWEDVEALKSRMGVEKAALVIRKYGDIIAAPY